MVGQVLFISKLLLTTFSIDEKDFLKRLKKGLDAFCFLAAVDETYGYIKYVQ